jgi:hypothetical protein
MGTDEYFLDPDCGQPLGTVNRLDVPLRPARPTVADTAFPLAFAVSRFGSKAGKLTRAEIHLSPLCANSGHSAIHWIALSAVVSSSAANSGAIRQLPGNLSE